jgi:hypothetical protein
MLRDPQRATAELRDLLREAESVIATGGSR